MLCPNCGADEKLEVKETRRASEGSIRRRRRCSSCSHLFTTIEQVRGDQLRVRKADGCIEEFDPNKIRKGIVKAAVRPHHANRLSELVDSVAGEALREAPDQVVASALLSEIVLRHLKDFDPVTHVRYALTQIGRRDNKGQGAGWQEADEFRRWLLDVYPQLEHFRPSTKCSQVVKRDGRREPYERKKLERSIGVASKGRLQSDAKVRDLAERIANRVEAELVNQALVTSGQLAAEIVRALREVDPIAALRFASTAKEFVSVEDYETEALGLRTKGSGRSGRRANK